MSISIDDIKRLAPILDVLPYDEGARMVYDGLCQGLLWLDEKPTGGPADDWWAIRPLLHHRTCLLLGGTSEYEDLWAAGQASFPNWPGFRKERLTLTPELRQYLATKGHTS